MERLKKIVGFIAVELGFTAIFVGIVIAMATIK